jgi:AcrR family transcriptional regulator
VARPTRVTPEDIERAAVDLVRVGGLPALTARGVADALGVSTQPVYSSWGSMVALRARVDQRVAEFIQQYLAQPEPGTPPMLSLGLRTVRLATEEPHLFDLAAAWMRHQLTGPPPPPIIAALRADPRLAAVSVERLTQVNTLMWIFTQGLAAMVRDGSSVWTLDAARLHLTTAGEAIIAHVASLPDP